MGDSGPTPAGQGAENLGEKHDLAFRDSHLAPTFPCGTHLTHHPWGSWDILLGSRFHVASPNMEVQLSAPTEEMGGRSPSKKTGKWAGGKAGVMQSSTKTGVWRHLGVSAGDKPETVEGL